MERLQFVAPWRELDPNGLLSKNGLHGPVQFTAVSEVAPHTPKANRHFKSVVCGTAAMLLTWLGSQRRKPARCQAPSTLRAQDKGAALNTPPPPPPPGPPPVPQAKAKAKSSSPSPAIKPPPPPPPNVEAAKDMPKSESPASASKASKEVEASKTTVAETSASTPVQKAAKDMPKSESPAQASTVSKALEAHIAFLEKELNQSNSSNEILKRQVEELESYKERNEQATKAAAENEKKQFRRPGGPDQKSLADAQKVAQLIGTAQLEEDSAQIKKLKESLEKAQDKCAAKESELSLLKADREKDSAQIQELKESLRAAQEKCAAKESDVFQMQLEKEQALTRAKGLEESLKKVQTDSEDTRQLKEVLKKIGEITAPFVDDGEDPSLLREKAEGSQRRAATLERDNQQLQAQLAQTSKELAELSEVQETLIAAEKRAESLSSGLRQISEQIGATGGGFLALFQQPSEDELIRDIQAEIQKLKS